MSHWMNGIYGNYGVVYEREPLMLSAESAERRMLMCAQRYQESFSSFQDARETGPPSVEMAADAPSSSRREPRTFSEPCMICGCRGTGHHYGVPSCNSCKTFFRRTVLSKKKYFCNVGENCIGDSPKGGKIRCKKCRFARCLKQGMRTDAVTTAEKNMEEEMDWLMRVEDNCHRADPENDEETEGLRRLRIAYMGGGENPRLHEDHERAIAVDLLRALRFASEFNEFHEIKPEKQANVVLRVLFPLSVAKVSLDFVRDKEPELVYGRYASMVDPFRRENVEHKEFVLLKSILFLQAVGEGGQETDRQAMHIRLLLGYLKEEIGQRAAPARYGTLLAVFQTFLASSSHSRNPSAD